MDFIKVSLVADQVAILLGLSHTYSNRFLEILEKRVAEAKTVAEVDAVVKTAHQFTVAKFELDKALYFMLDEGERREARNDKAPYEVLFMPTEHKFLTAIITSTFDLNHPAAKGYTEEQINKACALITGTSEALRAGVLVTKEQVTALRAEAAKNAPKSDAELVKGFFLQNKTGLA